MTGLWWAAIVALLLPALRLPAQTPMAPATIMSAERLRAIGDSLSPATSRTAQLGRGVGHTYAVTHRDSSGGIEVHVDWTDVFVVQSGSATMLTGGIAVARAKHRQANGAVVPYVTRRARQSRQATSSLFLPARRIKCFCGPASVSATLPSRLPRHPRR